MKKGEIAQGIVERVDFPNKGIVVTEDGSRVTVKNTVPGQHVRFRISKKRSGKYEGNLLEIVEKSQIERVDAGCDLFGTCGGCTYQNLDYDAQLKLKESQVRDLLAPVVKDVLDGWFLPAKKSPRENAYRNKMEYTFGNGIKDGPLTLGMHKRGSFYDIVPVPNCQIVDADFGKILTETMEFFREEEISFYHRMRHDGYLRHLLVRKAVKTGEILVDLVTASHLTDENIFLSKHFENLSDLEETYVGRLKALKLDGTIKGILHTINDSVADTITNEGTTILYGDDFFYEELLGLKFKISPFSFFQTNSLGAEVLYETAREFIKETGEADGKVVFDLYSGTGTIAQMLSPIAKRVVGVEIVPEAVDAARDNARENNLTNCTFLTGDVLKVLDTITEKPDFIVLDPPRDGIHPKALKKIIDYGVHYLLYISCKPTSLARDLNLLQTSGYHVQKVQCVDMFPFTANIETVALLVKERSDAEKQ